jgi:SAM-dependent methyltransferase
VTSELPDIARLSTVPLRTWLEFGRRLRECGLQEMYRRSFSRTSLRVYESLQKPLLIWRARNERDPGAVACRLFRLHDPVRDAEAFEVMGATLVADLLDAGVLVSPSPGWLVSPFEVRTFQDCYVLCDDLAHGGDAVFAMGPGTIALSALLPWFGCLRRVVDIGCGAGAVALWLARYAERVDATDINPRALQFLAVNSGINNVQNVHGRYGDLFNAVPGETFDAIVSQPPFVPCPGPDRRATYRFGGRRGDELAVRIIDEAPTHLGAHGRAAIVFEHPVSADSVRATGDAGLTIDPEVRALLLLGGEVDADAYSIRYAVPELRDGASAYDREALGMREHLNGARIAGFRPAVCLIEQGPHEDAWFDTVDAGQELWSEITSDAVERLFAGLAVVRRSRDEILRAGVTIPPQSLVIRFHGQNRREGEKVFLGLPDGYLLRSIEFTTEEWEILEQLADSPRDESDPDIFAATVEASPNDPADRSLVIHVITKAMRAGLANAPPAR